MGNSVMIHAKDGVPTLDDLGGWDRPAVKRADELNMKMNWLSSAVLSQADKMEVALDKRATGNKEAVLNALGAQKQFRPDGEVKVVSAFGGTSRYQNPPKSAAPPALKDRTVSGRPTSSASGMFRSAPLVPSIHRNSESIARPGTAVGAMRSGRMSVDALSIQRSAQSESAVMGARPFMSRPATSSSTQRPFTSAPMRPGTTALPGKRQPPRVGFAAERSGSGAGKPPRPRATGVSKSVDMGAMNSKASPYAQGSNGRMLGRSGTVAHAMALAERQKAEAALHWRERVFRAKRRLYLYLRGYMAWMSVLRKARKGYAEMFSVEVLPMFLTNVLGEHALQFGEHLKNCGGVVEVGHEAEARSKLTALNGGRNWMMRVKLAHLEQAAAAAAAGAADDTSSSTPAEQPTDVPVASTTQPETPAEPVGPMASTSSSRPTTAAAGLGNGGIGGRQLTAAAAAGSSSRPGTAAAAVGGAGAKRHVPHPPSTAQRMKSAGQLKIATDATASATSTTSPTSPNSGNGSYAAAAKANPLVTYGVLGPDGKPMSLIKQLRAARAAHDPQSSYAKEVDVVRKLTAAHMVQRSANPVVTYIGNKERADIDQIMKTEQVNLQVMANKANATWVEAHSAGWQPPNIVEAKVLEGCGVDVENYKKVVPELLAEGKVAVQIIYTGEEQVVGTDDKGVEVREPAISVDLWAAMAKMFPHKIPAGQRISGLNWLDRRVLQTIVDVEKLGGKGAVNELLLLLCVDSLHTTWVSTQIHARRHWGLQPYQVLVVSVARLPALMWEDATKTFRVNYSHQFPYASAGSGYAMLALRWPSTAFMVNGSGQRDYIPGCLMQLLQTRQVEYVYTTHLTDVESLTPNAPVLDTSFLGPALYAMDVKEAGMAMQVLNGGKADALARQQNSLVLAPDAGKPYAVNIALQDLQTPAGRVHLLNAQRRGAVVSCTNRYFFQLSYLQQLLQGPNSFHVDVDVRAPCAFLVMDIADLTSTNGTSHSGAQGRCVAVMGRGAKGPDTRSLTIQKEWLRDFGPQLLLQDNQLPFRQRVAAIASAAAPLTTVVNEAAGGPPGTKVLLFVKDNAASRMAFRMCRALLRQPNDSLVLVHVVSGRSSTSDGKALVEGFEDVMMEPRMRRRVVAMMDKLTPTLLAEVETLKPDLVVVGSEALAVGPSSKPSGGMAPLGSSASAASVALSLAKELTGTSLLVVKPNSVGEFFQPPQAGDKGSAAAVAAAASDEADAALLPPLRVAVELQTASMGVVSWLATRLQHERSRLILARPLGLDKENKETPQSSRMMATFATAVASSAHARCSVTRRPIAEGAVDGLPLVVNQERADVLALLAPAARITPPHLLDLLRNTRASVLVWRQARDADGW